MTGWIALSEMLITSVEIRDGDLLLSLVCEKFGFFDSFCEAVMHHTREADQVVSIVLADEDPDLIRLTVNRLHQIFGPIAVSGFSDSRQAAALLAYSRPSLLICSPQMPRVGGMDLITLAQKRWGQFPTIVLANSSGLGPSGSLRASSTVTFLEKPFSPESLHHCIIALTGLAPQPVASSVAVEPSIEFLAPELDSSAEDEASMYGPDSIASDAAAVSELVSIAPNAEVAAEPHLAAPPQSAVEPSVEALALGAELSSSELGHREPALTDRAEAPEIQTKDVPAGSAAFPSAETSPWYALQGDTHEGDPSLSSVTPLPISLPPGQENSDIWFQQPLQQNLPIDASASLPEALIPSDEGVLQKGGWKMALTSANVKENLNKLESVDGFIGAALADSDNGMCLGFVGGGGLFNLEVAAAGNTEVVRSKRKAIKTLNLRDDIEDFLITLGKQYHLIRPVRSRPSLFYYLVLDRQRANLAMARYSLADVERELPM